MNSTTNTTTTTRRSAMMTTSSSNNTIKRAKTTDPHRRRRVTFDDFNTAYHDPPAPLYPEDCNAAWYSADELKTNLQSDIRETIRAYFVRVQEGKQPDNKNYVGNMHDSSGPTYSRGLDLLSADEKNRKARCELYRSLVLRQYEALHAAMAGNHAHEMLQTFATEKSRWARSRASAIAAADATQARQVYREAFLAKEGVEEGCGILPSRRSLRGQVKRRSDRARSA